MEPVSTLLLTGGLLSLGVSVYLVVDTALRQRRADAALARARRQPEQVKKAWVTEPDEYGYTRLILQFESCRPTQVPLHVHAKRTLAELTNAGVPVEGYRPRKSGGARPAST